MRNLFGHWVVVLLLCTAGYECVAGDVVSVETTRFAKVASEIDPKTGATTISEKKLRLAALYHANESKHLEIALATEVGPGEVDIYVHILGLRMKLDKGDLYFGKMHLDRLLKEHPDNPAVLSLAAQYELKKETSDTMKAINFLRRAVEKNPYSAEALYELARYTEDDQEVVKCCSQILLLEEKGSSLASKALMLLESKKTRK